MSKPVNKCGEKKLTAGPQWHWIAISPSQHTHLFNYNDATKGNTLYEIENSTRRATFGSTLHINRVTNHTALRRDLRTIQSCNFTL